MKNGWQFGTSSAGRVMLVFSVVAGSALVASVSLASPYPLTEIMDKAMAEKLAVEKITTTSELLEKGATAKERGALAKKTKIPLPKLTEYVKLSDLVRIKGVGPEMTKLLQAGKITTVAQLKTQTGAKLHPVLMKANDKAKITEKPPTADQVQAWIDQAKTLPIVMK